MSNSGSGAYTGPGSRYTESVMDKVPERIAGIVMDVAQELAKATQKFGSFASAHEGYAVLKEEVDELWDEVKNNKHGDSTAMRAEALQVAAMACRFLLDISDDNIGKEIPEPAPDTSELFSPAVPAGQSQAGADYAGSTAPEERAPSDPAQHPDYMGAREAREDIRDSQGPVRVVTRRGDDAGAAPIFEDMSTRRGDRLHGLPLRGE